MKKGITRPDLPYGMPEIDNRKANLWFNRIGCDETENNSILEIVDIGNMPGYNPKVTNGIDSVSKGKVSWDPHQKAVCKNHGAMNAVSMDRRIWRCLTCHEGLYVREW